MQKFRTQFISIAVLGVLALSLTAAPALADDALNAAYGGAAKYKPGSSRDAGSLFGHEVTRAARQKKKKKNKKKKKKDKPRTSSVHARFIGKWSMSWQKVFDDCSGSSAPSTFSSSVNIDARLNGKDLVDGSPLFTGTVSGDSIAFARQGAYEGCIYTQGLQLANVVNGSAVAGLRSTISCGYDSCSIDYAGPATKQ